MGCEWRVFFPLTDGAFNLWDYQKVTPAHEEHRSDDYLTLDETFGLKCRNVKGDIGQKYAFKRLELKFRSARDKTGRETWGKSQLGQGGEAHSLEELNKLVGTALAAHTAREGQECLSIFKALPQKLWFRVVKRRTQVLFGKMVAEQTDMKLLPIGSTDEKSVAMLSSFAIRSIAFEGIIDTSLVQKVCSAIQAIEKARSETSGKRSEFAAQVFPNLIQTGGYPGLLVAAQIALSSSISSCLNVGSSMCESKI